MADGRVTLDLDGSVAVVTLDRQSKANALDMQMLDALERRLGEIECRDEIAAVLLAGAGKAFCAGGDVAAWSALAPEAFAHLWVRAGHRVFDRLARLRPPVIAVLDGHALGGGFELAAACDFRVAETQVRIGMPETGIGVVPGWSGTQRAVRRFGSQIVRRMMLGGETYDAERARALGLVDRVVLTGEGLKEAWAWAREISARGPAATAAAKLMLSVAEGEDSGAAVEALASAYVATTAELSEGVAAFREKRPANFGKSETGS